MIPTKTRGWRTYHFKERVVEIRKLYPKPGVTFEQTVREGLHRGYRYLNGQERQKLLQDKSSSPGHLAAPTDYWSAFIYEVHQNGVIREAAPTIGWLVDRNIPFSVLMAEN